jgi:SagB-type dehydrogenase family enzyme
MNKKLAKHREILKGYSIREMELECHSDQEKKLPQPPLEKPLASDSKSSELIALPPIERLLETLSIPKRDIVSCIRDRVSHRKFSEKQVTFEQLSFMLWATQGVKSISKESYFTKRTVPSSGARHPFETYLAVQRVKGLETGIYRYIATKHSLFLLNRIEGLDNALVNIACGQPFCGTAAVNFVWTAIPYRMEWRYMPAHSMKAIILDMGYVSQNLYLACEALGLGTCAIGAYVQEKADSLVGADGIDELVICLSPVGHPESSNSECRIS